VLVLPAAGAALIVNIALTVNIAPIVNIALTLKHRHLL